MGRTIQFESHRNELAAILELEHDSQVREFYDQPHPIKLNYRSRKGKRLGVLHTPDFFVLRTDGAHWLECKTAEDLPKLHARQPHRYGRDEAGRWRCPPAEEYAAQFGFSYLLKSSAEIDWTFQRNVLFLEDYLRASTLEVADETVACFQSLAAARPGLTLAEMLGLAHRHDLAADHLYALLVTDKLYVDLSEAPLSHPEQVHLFFSQLQAEAFATVSQTSVWPDHRPQAVDFKPGVRVQWDGTFWEIIHHGEAHLWLKDTRGNVTSLGTEVFGDLLAEGKITQPEQPSHRDSPTPDPQAMELLARASPAALALANRRYQTLTEFQQTGKITNLAVSQRTVLRWQARFRSAQLQYRCGFAGLLPRTSTQGNRARRLLPETLALMEESITRKYEQPEQPTRFAVWSGLLRQCQERGLPPPSYQTFCQAVKDRPRHEQILRRQGSRAAYQAAEVYLELELTTPRHGDRPFEIAHIDHTELDIQLVASTSRRNLGRPWATLMTDAYSRRVLSAVLCFDPPSYRSCMLAIRECVARFARLPQTIVMDGGREFGSIYFETLLARYEITKKTRPQAAARFGTVLERLFGVANSRFIYNLAGNTQLAKGNVRDITTAVDPQRRATWTLAALAERFAEFVYEVYDQLDHPALGRSPREVFTQGLRQSGERAHRRICDSEEFRILTLPSTAKGTAKVIPGRGVRINYLFYWNDAFRDGRVEGLSLPVRYDPFDAGLAYAFVHGGWRQCLSEHYADFRGRSEREIKIATAELRRQHQQHARSLTVTAHRLAEFLNAVQADEKLLQQRQRDAEAQRIQRGATNSTAKRGPSAAPEPLLPPTEPRPVDQADELMLLPELTVALDQLEIYEEC